MKEIDKRNKIIIYLVNENQKLGGKFSKANTIQEDVIDAYETMISKKWCNDDVPPMLLIYNNTYSSYRSTI